MTADDRVQVQHREEPVGRVGRELLPGLNDLRRVRPRPLEGVRRDLADRMRAEDQARDDPEVAATPAAKRPVEIGVLRARWRRPLSLPSASTTVASSRLSHVSPYFRDGQADAAAESRAPRSRQSDRSRPEPCVRCCASLS